LNPKKAKDFKKPTAEELDLSKDLVSKLIDFYWERVRRHMSGLEHEAIQINNLGIFKVKHWKIDETIEKYKMISSKAEGKFRSYAVKMDLTNQIEKLEKIKKGVLEREVKFKEIKDARKLKENMEEQDSNTSGSNEQDIQEKSCREDI